MKKIIVFICFLFLFLSKGVFAYYDESINKMVIDEKIEVKSDTKYYFMCVSLYGVESYFDILKEANVTNDPKLVLITDTINTTIPFNKMEVDGGVICYAEFKTSSDNYIYYMSYPVNDYLYKYNDYMFFLVEEENFNNYNSLYEYKYEEYDCDGIFYVSSDDMKDVGEILENIEAFDNMNGNIKDKIKIESNDYSINCGVGKYNMYLSVSDNNLNTSYFHLLIIVVDITPPYINTPKRIEVGKYELLDYFELLKYVDSDSLKNVRIEKNDYYKNYNVDGEYEVIFSVVDEYGNKGQSKMIVGVNPSKDIKYSLTKYTTDVLNVDMIVSSYFKDKNIVTDDYFIYKDNYSKNSNKEGNYQISLSYYDTMWHNDVINVDVLEKKEEKNEEIKKDNRMHIITLLGVILGILLVFIIMFVKKIKIKK